MIFELNSVGIALLAIENGFDLSESIFVIAADSWEKAFKRADGRSTAEIKAKFCASIDRACAEGRAILFQGGWDTLLGVMMFSDPGQEALVNAFYKRFPNRQQLTMLSFHQAS